jgi:hypothetical protein
LTGREIEAAAEAHRGGLASGSPRLWPGVLRRALTKGASDPEVLKAIADPLTGYDRFTLVKSGLLAWSYAQPIAVRPEKGSDALLRKAEQEARDAVIDDLDDEAVDFIATEVLRLTKPGLFHATEEDAAGEKKSA